MAILIRDEDCITKPSIEKHNTELIQVLLDYIAQKNIDFISTFTLYLYLENLLQIQIENCAITLETYCKALNFHSRVREKNDLLK